MEVLIGISFIFIGSFLLYMVYILSKKNSNDFMERESKRVLLENAKVSESYSSEGRVFTRGLSLIKEKKSSNKTNIYKFIPQAKVCDIGLY